MSPFSLSRSLIALTVGALMLAPAMAMSQAPTQGTLFLKTNVGSFKILGVEDRPAEGKVLVTFTGTLLVNKVTGADPKITVSGNLRKEYENKPHLQEAYHGTGTMTIEGKFVSIQWFGRDLTARWDGFGIARLVGEFDKDLKTGKYWYIQNPDDIKEWGTQLKTVTNPPAIGDIQLVPKGRKSGG